jgi:hypothetical protein
MSGKLSCQVHNRGLLIILIMVELIIRNEQGGHMAKGDHKRVGEEAVFTWPDKNTATAALCKINQGASYQSLLTKQLGRLVVGATYVVTDNYVAHQQYGNIICLEVPYTTPDLGTTKSTDFIWVSSDSCRSTLDPNLPAWW